MLVEEAVANGMSLLDKDQPGWYNRIDEETLDVSSPRKCILSQVYQHLTPEGYKRAYFKAASFCYAVDILQISDECSKYGFGRPRSGFDWPELQSEWIKQLRLCLERD